MLTGLVDGDIAMYRICYTVDPLADLRVVKNHVNTYLRSLLDRAKCSHYIGILGIHGGNNVKYNIFPEYKRGRPTEKPPHWNVVMNYMISEWGFVPISGCETDDAIAYCSLMRQTGEDCVVISSDKDLLQIPGRHFVMGVMRKGKIVREDKTIFINLTAAERQFYTQMLTGDIVDNVKTIHGIGPKTAEKLLKNCNDHLEMRIIVAKEYEKAFGDEWKAKYAVAETLLRVNPEYARLVGFERPKPIFFKDTQEY
jgi:DNA polymerase I